MTNEIQNSKHKTLVLSFEFCYLSLREYFGGSYICPAVEKENATRWRSTKEKKDAVAIDTRREIGKLWGRGQSLKFDIQTEFRVEMSNFKD